MDEMHRVIRIVFLDFRKAFDLFDHDKLLENMEEMGVRSALIKWFASYLDERSHFTQIGKEESDFEYVNGGVQFRRPGKQIRPNCLCGQN